MNEWMDTRKMTWLGRQQTWIKWFFLCSPIPTPGVGRSPIWCRFIMHSNISYEKKGKHKFFIIIKVLMLENKRFCNRNGVRVDVVYKWMVVIIKGTLAKIGSYEELKLFPSWWNELRFNSYRKLLIGNRPVG